MAMNLERLRIFILVAELRSFTKAAEALYISHSTTSRAVSTLEDSLGVRLIERDKHSVTITPAGQAMLSEGKKLLNSIEELERVVKAAESVKS